jgi:signal transduction histidine kinase
MWVCPLTERREFLPDSGQIGKLIILFLHHLKCDMRYIKCPGIFLAVLFYSLLQPARAQLNTDLYHNFKEQKEAAIAELKEFSAPDTNRVNALVKVFTTATFLKERQEVLQYRIEAMNLSRKLNFEKGIALCHLSTGNYYKSSLNYPAAIHQYDSALYLSVAGKDPKFRWIEAVVHEKLGNIYSEQGNYYAAIDHFFEALKYDVETSPERKIRLYSFITDVYISLNSLDKATEFVKRSIELLPGDTAMVMNASVYFSYIDISLAKNDYPTASFYLDKFTPYIPDPLEIQVNYGYYLKQGQLNYQQQNYRDAYMYFQNAFRYAITGGHKKSRNMALRYLSSTALKLGDEKAARQYALESLALSQELNLNAEKMEALVALAEYYNATGDKTRAFNLIQEAMQIKDSVMTETNAKQINVLGAIYETGKQNQEITRLQLEKDKEASDVKHKTVLNQLFIASIVILLIVGLLGYLNFKKGHQLAKQQQALQKQKIIELEKDKQLLSIDAMLKGQEEERSRIAKDLHDGLGSLLSGTKLSFMNVKEMLVLSPDNAELFDKSLRMLDNTIGDLRKVAQNLMPEALVKFGLREALRDFCESIQSTTGLKVFYQHFGEARQLDNTAQVFIYRIIQELVNNVVKHAEATEVIVQLATSTDKTVITVEDNGKGFNDDILSHTKGAGMANIRYRMQYFNGTLDIVTAPGKGTSVNIELIV